MSENQKVLFVFFLLVTMIHAFVTISYAKVIEFITNFISGQVRIDFQLVVIMSGLFILLTAAVNILGGYLKARVVNGTMNTLREKVFLSFIDNYVIEHPLTTGAKVSYLTSKLDVVKNSYVQNYLLGISLFFQFSFAVAMGITIDYRLTLFVLALEIPAILLPFATKNVLKKVREPVLNTLETYTSKSTNWLSGINVIRNFNREKTFVHLHDKQSLAMRDAQNRDMLTRKVVSGFSQLFGDIVYLGTWLIGGYFVIHHSLSLASLMGFNQLSVSISFPLEAASDLLSDIFGGRRAYEEIIPIIANNQANRKRVASPIKVNDDPFIEYTDVTITDPADPTERILQDISLRIGMSDKVLLIGKSGAGKSTLVNALFGHFKVSHGDIKVNGVSVRMGNGSQTSALIGYQEQKTFIFDGSLKQNVTLFLNDFADEDVIKVLAEVGFDDTYASKAGLKKTVQTKGGFLSGGQRQMIGLARNLLTDKKFMVFDELSSGLDPETTQSLERKVFSLGVGVIYITHDYDERLMNDANLVLEVQDKGVQVLRDTRNT